MPPPTVIQKIVNNFLADLALHRAALTAPRPDPLVTELAEWFTSLPIVTRNRRYQMSEISNALFTRTNHRYADNALSEALRALGWTAGRSWTRAGRNCRYHLPPQTDCKE